MPIPKNIIQTSTHKHPKYVADLFKNKFPSDFTYKYYTEDEIIGFFQSNYLEEFKNIADRYVELKHDSDKIDLFKFYYLYLKGGIYVDYFSIPTQNLDININKFNFVAVKSYRNILASNSILGTEPNNPIIYLSLKHLYLADLNQMDQSIKNNFLLNNIQNIELPNKQIFIEQKNDSIYDKSIESIVVDESNNGFILNYPSYSIIKSPVELPIKMKKPLNQIKIGISFDMPENFESLYCNGIRQNILYFNELLLNIGYDAYFVVKDHKLKNPDTNGKIFYDKRFKPIGESDIFTINFDIFIVMGYELTTYVLSQMKYMKTKIVLYQCGNAYIIDSENTLYKQNVLPVPEYSRIRGLNIYDEIWSIPQMANTNQHYWKTLYRCDCLEVPFVWSNVLLDIVEKNLRISSGLESLYTKRNNSNVKKRIAIFEPNISIMKWGLPALLVCENSYRTNKNLIENVYFNNVYNKDNTLINKDNLNKLVSGLDLFVDGKISIEARYNILYFMSRYADYAVSHQWENNLNYIYLDLAWMGYPIIHNASLCKDIGYYYPEFNYEIGGQKLTEALNLHDLNAQAYLEKNRKIIDRYLPSNKELQNTYRNLLDRFLV